MTASTVEPLTVEPPASQDRPVRDVLRELRLFSTGSLPAFDPADAPATPEPLFVEWLYGAIAAQVPEPHVMNLSTVDADGRPSARQYTLKDVDERGWQFAVNCTSGKGKELAVRPWAALTFYWQPLARQVRIKGSVRSLGVDISGADCKARPASAKLSAVIGRQSQPLGDPADLERAAADAAERLARDPALITPEWRLYTVKATEVEFFQGAPDHEHVRLRYRRSGTAWTSQRLWP